MSGYNAEYGIPAGDNDNAEETTVAPIILTNKPAPYNAWEFMGMLSSRYLADELIEEQEMGDFEQYDKARLIQTVRNLINISNRIIQADDHRIAHIWESAGEIADQKGYCDVFDSFMDELGTGYAREEDMVTYVNVSVTIPVYTTVRKGSDPEDQIDSSMVEDAFNNADIDIESGMWTIDYSESAE